MDIALWIVLGIVGALFTALIIYLLFLTVCALCVKKIEYKNHSKFYRHVLNRFAITGLWFLRVKIKITGKEKVDGLNRFLIVSNHRSNLDPIAIFLALKKHDIAFISKPENFKIVFMGRIIRKCCFKAIDRENPRNAIKTIIESADLIKRDQVSIGVFPEGTRSKTGELLPFHDGVLKIASHANVPIVVASVKGGEDFKKRFPFKRTKIFVDVIDVISADRVKEVTTHDLSNEIKDMIATSLA